MVVGDSHGGRFSVIPTEYQAPLLVDSHAPETLEIAGEGFQAVAGRETQIGEPIGRVKLPTPISPPSGPSHWLFQGPPAESKFLAASQIPRSQDGIRGDLA